MTLPPLAVQSCAFEVSVKPWPLQAFCPLQALLAPLQALCPLQALLPPHFMPSAWAAVTKVPAAKIAAAVVISVRLVMSSLPKRPWRERQGARVERAFGSYRVVRDQSRRRYGERRKNLGRSRTAACNVSACAHEYVKDPS